MKIDHIIMALCCVCLSSCFETIDIDIKGQEGQSFPYIEVVYFSKKGWKTLITPTQRSDNGKTNDFEVEYIKLYENGQEVFANYEVIDSSQIISYIPKEGQTYFVTVKITGYDEIRSEEERFEPTVEIDSIRINERGAVCSWTNTDPNGSYYILPVNPKYYTSPIYLDIQFVDNISKQLPNTMLYSIDLEYDTIYVSLHRPSTDLKLFYQSVRDFEATYNDGVIDPHSIYSNLSHGYGIFGFNSQSEVQAIPPE